jgi:hypothetical protein
MKKLLIVAVAFFIGSTAFAQSTTLATHYGLKAGINLSKYNYLKEKSTNDAQSTVTNFHITGYMDSPLGSMFSIQPGLSLQGKGSNSFNGLIKQNTMWIEVPVNLIAKFPIIAGTNFFLGAGPYAAFGIAGKNKSSIGSDTDTKFGNDSGDDLKSLDFGLNFIGGVQLKNHINIGAGYGLGLSDLRPTESGGDGKTTHRVWSFSIGYAF